jgi:hypothetical protein
MKVRLLKRWRVWPIGRVIEVFDTKAKQLIQDGYAEMYNGEYPPAEKMKTDFFKPKR